MLLRCVAGDEALEKQKKEIADLKRKVENAQAAMMELTQENQSLQVSKLSIHQLVSQSVILPIFLTDMSQCDLYDPLISCY